MPRMSRVRSVRSVRSVHLGSGMLFRLLIGMVVIVIFGYMGEALILNSWHGSAVFFVFSSSFMLSGILEPNDFNGYGYFYVRLYWTGFGFSTNIVEEYVMQAAWVAVRSRRTAASSLQAY